MLTRRAVLAAAGAAAVGPTVWARLLSAAPVPPVSFIDDLLPPDANGLRLPPGFASRLLATSGSEVSKTGFVWHEAPDGGGVVARPGGGWVYASNAEVSSGGGGVSVLEFGADGSVTGARTILAGTSRNCAGGMTPWGTWLSCEEVDLGKVYECDPLGPSAAVVRPAMGAFRHEAAAVDPVTGDVYLTEDRPDGRLYKFAPITPGNLATGQLFAASIPKPSASVAVGESVAVEWLSTSASAPDRRASTSAFDGGEGAWVDGDRLLFATKGDVRVWALDIRADTLTVLHDCLASPDTPLNAVDNVVVHQGTGDVYIAEDGGNMQLCVLRDDSDGVRIEAMVQIVGQDASEITGPAFSLDGQRLYFSSQRGVDGRGLTYEVVGPFPRPAIGLASTGGLDHARRTNG